MRCRGRGRRRWGVSTGQLPPDAAVSKARAASAGPAAHSAASAAPLLRLRCLPLSIRAHLLAAKDRLDGDLVPEHLALARAATLQVGQRVWRLHGGAPHGAQQRRRKALRRLPRAAACLAARRLPERLQPVDDLAQHVAWRGRAAGKQERAR